MTLSYLTILVCITKPPSLDSAVVDLPKVDCPMGNRLVLAPRALLPKVELPEVLAANRAASTIPASSSSVTPNSSWRTRAFSSCQFWRIRCWNCFWKELTVCVAKISSIHLSTNILITCSLPLHLNTTQDNHFMPVPPPCPDITFSRNKPASELWHLIGRLCLNLGRTTATRTGSCRLGWELRYRMGELGSVDAEI